MNNKFEKNKEIATRYIEAFNTDDWDTVREVVAPDFTFHHPIGGTVKAGPEGMVGVWSDFKASLPDSWHPIPIMITDGDYLAVLLPTYGHFTGKPYHGVSPTGKWIEYGMVNIVRFENRKIAENWFGMDPLAEQQQMGSAPSFPPRQLNEKEKANIELFQQTINKYDLEFDNLTSFDDAVLALGPPQHKEDTSSRQVEIYRNVDGSLEIIYVNQFVTNPPYTGNTSADTEFSRDLVKRYIKEVLIEHDLEVLSDIVSENILVHPTAMPCEASYFSISGISNWLNSQWKSFPDLKITDSFTISEGDIVAVHWTAQGTSKDNFFMLPPSGKKVQYTGNSMYRIEEGKIAEIWDARNTLGIMKQINLEIGGEHHH
ncbi:ester cyclase [Thermoplasmatota archaeon]